MIPAAASKDWTEVRGDDQLVAGLERGAVADGADLDQDIVDGLAIGDGAVARDGPGRGRPDDGGRRAEDRIVAAHDREAQVDRGRDVVVVFELGLGQRRLLDHRPEHRFGAAEEPAVQQELADLPGDLRLRSEGHGGVGMPPVALDAEAPEILALLADPVVGELAAFLAELDDGHGVLVLALGAILLLDLPFDGEPVAVPARNVIGVLAQHLLGTVDHVLQDLVEGGADMDGAVGIRRPVMEHEFRPALRGGAKLLEQLHLLPALQGRRLALRQVGAHGEIRARQEYGRLVVADHRLTFVAGAARFHRRSSARARPVSAWPLPAHGRAADRHRQRALPAPRLRRGPSGP